MFKNLDFLIKSLIIYITLGFAYCATAQLLSKYTHYAHTIAFIGFWVVTDRLIRCDKQEDIKLFKRINIVWLHLLITGITIFCMDLFHLI